MNPSNTTFARLLVLLDPTTPSGDAGAALASSLAGADGAIHLAVASSGPEAWPFAAFGEAEYVSPTHAARRYLDQVSGRIAHTPASVTTIDGIDLTADLAWLVARLGADALVVPAGLAARTLATKRSWGAIPCPVIVAPALPVAA